MLPVKSQSYCTPSSHQVWQKKAESQTSEKPSKVKMQASEFPSKQPLKQIFPTNHIMWDGMSKGNFALLLFLLEILLE
jgi:hypothetical protein